jgi:hypothetical protein
VRRYKGGCQSFAQREIPQPGSFAAGGGGTVLTLAYNTIIERFRAMEVDIKVALTRA